MTSGAITHRPQSDESVRFRRIVIDAYWDDARFGYIDSSRFVGTCPACGTAAVVRFAGSDPRAAIDCDRDCAEADVAAAVRARARR